MQLVEVNHKATMKLSEDVEKMTIPGRKRAYRLYGLDGMSLVYSLAFEGCQPEWCISSIICRRDTPFWLGTLDLLWSDLPKPFFLCLCLSVSLSVCLCLSVCLSVCLSLSLSLFPPPPPSPPPTLFCSVC